MKTQDELFGTLTWNADMEWWEGTWNSPDGDSVVVYVVPEEEDDKCITQDSRAAFQRVLSQPPAFRQMATDDLLEHHNSHWHHDEKTPPLTSAQFQARMTLESIEIEADGDATAWYDDGDLFWGHSIRVPQAADGSFSEATFEG